LRSQTSGCERINIHGAINLETGQTWLIDIETVNAGIRLLKTMVTYYVALPFVRLENGGLAPGQTVECAHSASAIHRADAMSRSEMNAGAVAFVLLRRCAGTFQLLAVVNGRRLRQRLVSAARAEPD
jgi:hypothetical protein